MQAPSSRRVALRWLVLGGLAAVASRAAYLRVTGNNLLGNTNAMEAAERLGATYLTEHPQEADANALCRAVFSTDLTELEALDSEFVRTRVVAAARADFQAGRVLELREWCLSRSEARLCGLVFLLSNKKETTG